MVTIAGNGMGAYTFENISLNLDDFDTIVCDVNFQESGAKIKKLKYKEIKEYILKHYMEEDILYVVTGSPLFYSAATLIGAQLPREYVTIYNNTSSKTYMLERFMIAENSVGVLSLHGRSEIDLTQFLVQRYTFILCDKFSIERVQKALRYIDAHEVEVHIGYKLGYDDEVIEQIDIFGHNYKSFDLSQPYVLLIKRAFELQNGLAKDGEYATQRGMITKEYKRHLSLHNLDIEPNHLLWDVGAGSGSCGIEAYTRYKARVVFFEKQPQRIEYIETNLRRHKVLDCVLHEGEAQDIFAQIEQNPDRIFVGGGGVEVIQKLPLLYERLNEAGVMVISAITLKHLTLMLHVLNDAKIEYEVFSLSLTTYKGKLDMVEPERQLFQIKVQK